MEESNTFESSPDPVLLPPSDITGVREVFQVEGTPPIRYRVDWHRLFELEVRFWFKGDPIEFDSFVELKDYVATGLSNLINGLIYIKEEFGTSEHFDDLGLDWWEQFIEEIEDEPTTHVSVETGQIPGEVAP